MAEFPKLKSGAAIQYPAARRLEFSSQVLRFIDGTEQSFRWSGPALRSWEIHLDLLDEAEMAAIEQFVSENEGEFESFRFVDPWDGVEYADCSLEGGIIALRMLGEMRGQTSLVIRENRS